jgi:hypothetical protein
VPSGRAWRHGGGGPTTRSGGGRFLRGEAGGARIWEGGAMGGGGGDCYSRMPLLCGGNESCSACRLGGRGYMAEVGLVGWNGAFGPGGLGIDSCLY